ncbi:MAG: ATP-dependent DNA helicase RecG [Alphaproteobacteria bacterium]
MRPELLYDLYASHTSIRGVGPKIAKLIERLAGHRLLDLCWHFPSGVTYRKGVAELRHAEPGELITVELSVAEHLPPKDRFRSRMPYKVVCTDSVGFFTDLAFFNASHDYMIQTFPIGRKVLISGKFEIFRGRWQITHPDFIGDPAEKDRWVGFEPTYPLTKGLTQNMLSKTIRSALERCPELPEWILPSTLQSHKWASWRASVLHLHNPNSEADVDNNHPCRRRLAYDEFLANQLTLMLVRQFHKKQPGRSSKGDGSLRKKVLDQLPFDLTKDQQAALKEIFHDMAQPYRMVRLLQGDVGSGKTLVGLMAMLNAIEAGGQTALLAPTEILAKQHAETLSPLAEEAGLILEVLTGKGKGRKQILERLKNGDIDILVGTHALIQDDVVFDNLSFAVIDEQHRFGVEQRLRLAAKGDRVDTLLMTATPIPRTLMLACYGDLETSQLKHKPPGRKDVATSLVSLGRYDEVIESLQRAISNGRKVYWVCPLVEESEVLDLAAAKDRYDALCTIFPDKVGLVHGKMKSAEKDAVMEKFMNGEYRILVATTVIEVGVHVGDATVMIIEHAERFGLSQLHQLRGRVGRGADESVCMLLYDENLTSTAKSRLKIMRETNDGFKIAEEDLRLRGGGDALGLRQSGLPDLRIGDYEAHQDLLKQAHQEAELTVSQDPNLQSQRGRALRTLLYLFEKDTAVEYLKAG